MSKRYIPSEDAQFVNALRNWLGLSPLYGPDAPSEYRQSRDTGRWYVGDDPKLNYTFDYASESGKKKMGSLNDASVRLTLAKRRQRESVR